MNVYVRKEEGSGFPAQPLTQGPRQHFFGYYDKCPWNASGRYHLAHEAGFAGRQPTEQDTVTLGYVDLNDGHRFVGLAETRAWNWQQGAMLQWHPAEPEGTILYNDRRDGRFVCVVRQIAIGREQVLPRPVGAVSHDGKTALGLNFSRLADHRPGYGYAGIPDPFAGEFAPEHDGIYRMDLATGQSDLILSVAQVAAISPLPNMKDTPHWVNHLLFSPDDRRFLFVHRWRINAQANNHWQTRLFSAALDGSDLFCLNDHVFNSHYDWRDDDHVLTWARRHETGTHYYLFTDRTPGIAIVGEKELSGLGDGHCSYSPDRRWILTDTYPNEKDERRLLLYHPATKVRTDLGSFYSVPWETPARCDLHPRWSQDGKQISFDSSHTGARQIYSVDLHELLNCSHEFKEEHHHASA